MWCSFPASTCISLCVCTCFNHSLHARRLFKPLYLCVCLSQSVLALCLIIKGPVYPTNVWPSDHQFASTVDDDAEQRSQDGRRANDLPCVVDSVAVGGADQLLPLGFLRQRTSDGLSITGRIHIQFHVDYYERIHCLLQVSSNRSWC